MYRRSPPQLHASCSIRCSVLVLRWQRWMVLKAYRFVVYVGEYAKKKGRRYSYVAFGVQVNSHGQNSVSAQLSGKLRETTLSRRVSKSL